MNYFQRASVGYPYDPNRGEWVIGILYKVDDIVEHNDNSYRCKAEHTSSASIEPGYKPRYWELYGVGP